MTKNGLYEFISKHAFAVLGTVSPAGQPESALMRIVVTEELEIFFDTRTVTRKYRNFLSDAACSFVIGCSGPSSLQYEGTLRAPSGAELERLKALYFAAVPDARERESWPDIAYLVARPQWIRFSDYGRQPPGIAEFTF